MTFDDMGKFISPSVSACVSVSLSLSFLFSLVLLFITINYLQYNLYSVSAYSFLLLLVRPFYNGMIAVVHFVCSVKL